MESTHGDKLTTRAVLAALLLSMGALVVGLVLAAGAEGVARRSVPVSELPAAVLEGEPGAWLTLGLVLLLLTPLVRLSGMLREFVKSGQRRAAASAGGVTLLLLISLVFGLQGRKLGAGASQPAPVNSGSK